MELEPRVTEQPLFDLRGLVGAVVVEDQVDPPLAIGVAIRRWLEANALRIHTVMRRVSIVLFVLVLAGAIFQEHEHVL